MRAAGGVLAPLRHRDFRLVAIGLLVSLVGDGVFRVSIALQVYAIDRDPRSFAAVGLVWTLSQVLMLPVGGWASDRFRRRTIVLAADLWRAAAIGTLGTLSLADRLTIPNLLVVAACFGAGNAFFNPAATALLPELVAEEDLGRANALLGAVRPTALFIVGPFLGAVLLSLAEPGAAFVFDAATFLASAAAVALVAGRPARPSEATGVIAQLREVARGLSIVRRTRWLWVGMLGNSIAALAFNGPFESLVPYRLVEDFGYDAARAGLALAPILAASGVGALSVLWWIGRRDLPRRIALTFYWGEAVGLLGLVVLGLMTAAWQGIIAGVVIGATTALVETAWFTTLQRRVPGEYLGRVSSLDWMVAVGLIPLSYLATGQLAALLGAQTVLVATGLLGAAVMFSLAFVPGARSVERLDDETADTKPALV